MTTDYNVFLETKVDFILALQKDKQVFETTTQLNHVDKILSVFCISTQLPSTERLIQILNIIKCLKENLFRWNSLLLLT